MKRKYCPSFSVLLYLVLLMWFQPVCLERQLTNPFTSVFSCSVHSLLSPWCSEFSLCTLQLRMPISSAPHHFPYKCIPALRAALAQKHLPWCIWVSVLLSSTPWAPSARAFPKAARQKTIRLLVAWDTQHHFFLPALFRIHAFVYNTLTEHEVCNTKASKGKTSLCFGTHPLLPMLPWPCSSHTTCFALPGLLSVPVPVLPL